MDSSTEHPTTTKFMLRAAGPQSGISSNTHTHTHMPAVPSDLGLLRGRLLHAGCRSALLQRRQLDRWLRSRRNQFEEGPRGSVRVVAVLRNAVRKLRFARRGAGQTPDKRDRVVAGGVDGRRGRRRRTWSMMNLRLRSNSDSERISSLAPSRSVKTQSPAVPP